jgi:hypothetical protein
MLGCWDVYAAVMVNCECGRSHRRDIGAGLDGSLESEKARGIPSFVSINDEPLKI